MDINELIALAEQGNVQAIADLACEYLNGEFVEQDLEKGATLMEKAANAGHALATLNMSSIYRDGDGVPQSFQKAEEWALRAAELGEPDELRNIALSYIIGNAREDNPYEADFNKAFKYFMICSKAGSADATANIGDCYKDGWGTEKDIDQAISWYKKAAIAGSKWGFEGYALTANTDKQQFISSNIDLIRHFANDENGIAQDLLADAYYFGYGAEMSDELSFQWREKAANNGYADAQCAVAEWYANGINGKSVDNDKALALWCAAAEQGHRLAKVCVAHQLIEHTYSPQDQAKAISYYTEVAELGLKYKHSIFTDAQLFLGDCYLEGKGVPQNMGLAEKWLSAAASNDSKIAQNLLATKIYLNSQNDKAAFWLEKLADSDDEQYANSALDLLGQIYMISTKEYDKAVSVLKKEIEKGIGGSQAIYMLGMCYAHGLGIGVDSQQAIHLFRKASEAGHKGAQAELEALIKKNEKPSMNTKSKFGLGTFFKK